MPEEMAGTKIMPRPIMEVTDKNLARSGILRDFLFCAVIACDGAGTLTALSPEAEQIIGKRAGEMIGRSVAVLPAALKKIIDEILVGGKSVVDRQTNLADPDPEAAVVRVHGTVVPGVPGKPSGVILVLTELSRLRSLEQSIRQLDRLANLGTLSASLAHEIKNSLVAVKTFVDLLLEKRHDTELAEVVNREMNRIDSLVTQMLRVASPARGAVAPVSVHEVLDLSQRLLQHQINEKLIVVRRSLTTAPDVVMGNGYQLEQAFMNLLLNALEAMGPHGELTISTEILPAAAKKSGQICVAFQDSGIGITPENLEHLFETFFTTKKNGTGLGLAITRRIIQEHHGEISGESHPNRGSIFRVILPLVGTEN